MSSCPHAEEVVGAAVVALIFIRAAMEKSKPSYSLAIIGKEEEEINLHYQETWHEETLTLKDSINWKNLSKRWILAPSGLQRDAGGGREEDQRGAETAP
jgi:hypothetical protein